MKKFIQILLAFLLLVNSGGFVIVFFQLRNSVKLDMKERIRNEKYLLDEIVSIRIRRDNLYKNSDQITWEDEKEFKMDNKLFDIIEIVQDDTYPDYIVIRALNDTKEEHILKTFGKKIDLLVNEKLNSPNVKTILFNLISQALPHKYFSLAGVNPKFIIIINDEFTAQSNIISPADPPPKYM